MSVWRDSENWLNEVEAADLACLTPREKEEWDRLAPPRALWNPLPGPQTLAFNSPADVLGFGGSAGGGKTDGLLGVALTGHQRSIIFRREAKQGRSMIDRSRELLAGIARFNAVEGVWRDIPGGRQLEFAGVKDPGDVLNWRGQPHDFIGIDEADSFLESQVRFLMGWLRTTTPGQRCRAVLTFNPPATATGRWLLDFFAPWLDRRHPRPAMPGELRWFATVKGGKEVERPDGNSFTHEGETIRPRSRTFVPSRVTDNPYLMATDYVTQLQALPEPLRSQLLYGDMDAGIIDDAWQVIPTEWVRAAQERWTPHQPPGLRQTRVGVDVAYGGSDATVVAALWGHRMAPLKKYRGAVTDSGQKAAYLVIQEHNGMCPVNVDVIGYGAACHEYLRDRIGELAMPVCVGASSSERDGSGRYRLANVRAAMYWRMRDALDPQRGATLALPPDPELLADLTSARFVVRGDSIILEPKDKVKERTGRSPDCADAACLALWDGGGQTPRALIIDGNRPEPGSIPRPKSDDAPSWLDEANDEELWRPW